MSMTTTIDHAHRRVHVKVEGIISLNDIRAHLEEERIGIGLTYDELIDAHGFSINISQQAVHTLVEVLRRLGKESRLGPTAVIVDSDIGYGMLRMLSVLVEDVCQVQPFRQQEEAEQWLAKLREDGT
ncbi:MAG: STAS/SEC14 domain-containing protein [Ignavibacteriae bacterium]|nr:MAG: STAS/SEC14 domain-containing protein [Ignavibacteriota bacterium]